MASFGTKITGHFAVPIIAFPFFISLSLSFLSPSSLYGRVGWRCSETDWLPDWIDSWTSTLNLCDVSKASLTQQHQNINFILHHLRHNNRRPTRTIPPVAVVLYLDWTVRYFEISHEIPCNLYGIVGRWPSGIVCSKICPQKCVWTVSTIFVKRRMDRGCSDEFRGGD